jgi:hypothetical protein
MLVLRQIWTAFAVIHDRAPKEARRVGLFSWWVRGNYGRSMGSAIRRQVDVREDVVSLGRLIDRIWRYPTVLSRERYRSLHKNLGNEADEWFDELAPGSDSFINPEVPADDLETLRSSTEGVRRWVNKAVAHADAKEYDSPNITELHSSLDVVFDLFNKYEQLLFSASVGRYVLMPAGWAKVFRVPWIPDEQWGPVMKEVEDSLGSLGSGPHDRVASSDGPT